jgi:NADH-quinone oxidoreductase subunit C
MDVSKPISTNYGYFREKFGAEWAALAAALPTEHLNAIEAVWMPETQKVDLPTFFVKKDSAIDVLRGLKEKHGFNFLTDYTATDEEETPRFHLVIHLMSLETKARIRVKIKIGETETMPTLIPLWEGANWAEREIWDMFGIVFEGHPDLRRILMDMRWEGHPLRKDYPLRGYQIFLTPEPLDPELLK